MRKGVLKKWLLWLAAAWLVVTLLPLDRENPPVTGDLEAPPEVAALLRRACYDCHSHETQWPWYAYVAPANLLVTQDVDAGRHHLNFSTWAALSRKQRKHALEEIDEVLADGEMPPPQYGVPRARGRLSEADVAVLRAWAAQR